MQQGEILSCSLPVSHTLPWRLCGWRLLSPWLSQCSYKQKTRTVLRHPGRVLSSTLPSFCSSRGDRSSIYPATTMDPLLVRDLKCPEQLVGQSCGLWPLAKGSLMVKPDPKLQSRKWQPNQAQPHGLSSLSGSSIALFHASEGKNHEAGKGWEWKGVADFKWNLRQESSFLNSTHK